MEVEKEIREKNSLWEVKRGGGGECKRRKDKTETFYHRTTNREVEVEKNNKRKNVMKSKQDMKIKESNEYRKMGKMYEKCRRE